MADFARNFCREDGVLEFVVPRFFGAILMGKDDDQYLAHRFFWGALLGGSSHLVSRLYPQLQVD